MDLVDSVLKAEADKKASYKSTEVHKALELNIDEGNLLAVDPNELEMKNIRSKKEEYLIDLARDCTQLLINKIWDLPVERVEDAVLAKLPDPKTLLPREKPIPKKKASTKWEEYAKLKGIQKKKKGRKVWDDELKQWVPRWGFKSKNDEKRDWLLEVPQNADPYEDQFEKKKKAKKERVAKNELQRLRNIARNTKGKVPGVGLTPTETPDKDHLSAALTAARKSDASLGRFSKRLPDEEKKSAKTGKKRKYESNTGDMGQEKKRALDILNKVQKNVPLVDRSRAGNLQLHEEETDRSQKAQKPSKKGGGAGGKGKSGKKGRGKGGGKGFKKPGGKGKSLGGSKKGGKKRGKR